MFQEISHHNSFRIRGLALAFNRGERFVFNGRLWLSTSPESSEGLLYVGISKRPNTDQFPHELKLDWVYQMKLFTNTLLLFRKHPGGANGLRMIAQAPREVRIVRESVFRRDSNHQTQT